jgi:hypothetical protein
MDVGQFLVTITFHFVKHTTGIPKKKLSLLDQSRKNCAKLSGE